MQRVESSSAERQAGIAYGSTHAEPPLGDGVPTGFEILLAEDDADDRGLAQDARRASGFPHEVRGVVAGQDLLDCPCCDGPLMDRSADTPRPAIVLQLRMGYRFDRVEWPIGGIDEYRRS